MHNANRRPRTPFLFLSIHSCSFSILATPSGLHVMSCTLLSFFSRFFSLRIPASHLKISLVILHEIGKMYYCQTLICLSIDLLFFLYLPHSLFTLHCKMKNIFLQTLKVGWHASWALLSVLLNLELPHKVLDHVPHHEYH